jgi:REP element-mobilizing transposase RayT
MCSREKPLPGGKIVRLFIEVLMDYRTQKKYLLHEFVVMPEHLHLIITPTKITLERAMQCIKGGFSFQLNKNLRVKKDVWQPSFLTGGSETHSNTRSSKITSGRIR